MWLRKALSRFSLPLPVTLKRFAADFTVFIFGMKCSSVRLMDRKK
jgi:hypothetical protein